MAVESVTVKNVTGKASGRTVFDVKREYTAHYTVKTTAAFSALKARLTEEIRVEALNALPTAVPVAP